MKRGFSFSSDDSLSMSMGLTDLDAEELIKKVSEKDLKNILKFFEKKNSLQKLQTKLLMYEETKIYHQAKN